MHGRQSGKGKIKRVLKKRIFGFHRIKSSEIQPEFVGKYMPFLAYTQY
jgi:hypothetical protein